MRWWLAILLLGAPPAVGEPVALRDAAREHAYLLSLDADGGLVGSGADVLIAGGRLAQFVLVGEEHGVAEVPAITTGLFRALVPSGYRHLAIETGFSVGLELNRRAASGGVEAIREFVDEYYPGTPFYGVREEAQMLADIVEAAGGGHDVLWGLDYEVMGDRYPLRRLRELATSDEARRAVEHVIAVADSQFAAALEAGNPGALFCFSGDVALIENLMEVFEPDPESEAWRTVLTLEKTLRINQLWIEQRHFESNSARAANLKQRFMREYGDADTRSGRQPKVMLKFGANHVLRGFNFNEQLDLGTLTSVLADANGSRSFGVLIVGGKGSEQADFDPATFGVAAQPTTLAEEAWMEPFTDVEQWTVFDLRPLLQPLLGGEFGEVPGKLTQIVQGTDVLVVIPNATAGTHLAPR